jgi:hypothetical protein
MPDRFRGLVVTIFLAAAGLVENAAAQEEPAAPRPGDYAYAWPVETPARADFHELELPLEVYRAVVDPSLRDLGIFDGRDRIQPRLVSQPLAPQAQPDEAVALPLLPVLAPAGTALSDVRFTLEQQTGETRVRVEGLPTGKSERPLVLVAYLADMGEEHARLRALELAWPQAIEPLIATVTVEASLDLDHWAVIGRSTVAGLRQDAASIERRRVAVNSQQARYLRVTWQGVPAGWQLTGLTAKYSRAAPEPGRDWQVLRSTGSDAADRGFLYDLGGAPMVDRAAVELGADNALLRASLHCRNAGGDPWARVHEGLFYRLRRDGNALASEPAELAPRRCRFWKMRIERGASDVAPALRLGWRPDRVLFMAEGAGPWRLAAGSARDAAHGFPQERYADAEMRELAKKATVGVATLGARAELGGESARQLPRSPDWRRWALWLGLVAGVLLVAGMAFKLVRARGAPGAAGS